MVREIHGAKIDPKSSFKNQGAQNKRGRKLREQIRYLPIGCPETSVNNCQYMLRNITEDRRCHLTRDGSLKSLTSCFYSYR